MAKVELSDVDEHYVREEMAELRERVRGRANTKNPDANRAARSRHAKDLARKLLKSYQTEKRAVIPQKSLLMRYQRNSILDGLLPNRKDSWSRITERLKHSRHVDIDLNGFSFLENPDKGLEAIDSIGRAECKCASMRINFPDQYIQDVGSYLIFSEVWPAVRHVVAGGQMQRPVQRVLAEMGLRREMGVTFNAIDDKTDFKPADIWTMPVQRRRPINRMRAVEDFLIPQTADLAADKFGNLVNAWLSADGYDMELTGAGMGNLKNIFGELLCNAERHSIPGSRDGDWTMAAFMARRDKGSIDQEYVCQVAVMSLGQSIAESYRTAPDPIAQGARAYAKKHRNGRQSIETLMTLVALQDGVTTDAEAWAEGNAGMGMQHAIEFFDRLGVDSDAIQSPRMTIISGQSCIMLKDAYIRGTRPTGDSDGKLKPRQLWFNAKNDSHLRPDDKYVFDLKRKFAGTLVTMAFTLDLEYLRKTLESDNDSNADN